MREPSEAFYKVLPGRVGSVAGSPGAVLRVVENQGKGASWAAATPRLAALAATAPAGR